MSTASPADGVGLRWFRLDHCFVHTTVAEDSLGGTVTVRDRTGRAPVHPVHRPVPPLPGHVSALVVLPHER
ncbi:hypothetical protein ACWF94_12020 [Streptomyces sp. NPDC055078]